MTISLRNRQDAMTPILTVIEPRGLAARTVAYYRSNLEEPVSERVTRQQFDAAGRPIACTDPRLGAPNQSAVFSLSNRVLLTDSVDAGWRLLLADANANNAESWDSRGSHWRTEFDELTRPVAISEQGPGQPEQVITRLGYGAVSAPAAAHNQCGRLVRNDDSAGTQLFADYTLSGTALSATRHFLTRLQTPDWPQPVTERDALLEPGSGATTNWQYSALGETTCQIDASGHQQRTSYNVAGEVNGATLQLKGGTQTAVFHSVAYNSFGQIESQTLGNGVTRTSQYDPASGRLIKLTSTRPGSTLQSLSYQYDPVGNVLQIEDFAQSVHFFAHHKTSPINTYRYDSLYQLIEATGSEALGASIGPHLPELAPNPGDLSLLVNYRQTYQYDAGGNLTELRHTGQQNYTRTMLIAPKSNRGLTQLEIPDFNAAFDANGNQQALQPGQPLSWDNRNQLSRTVQVSRQGGSDDEERYIYDASGQRLRKVGTRQAKMVTHTSEVRYLPGLEIHTHEGERLEVVIATAVRCLHWAHGKPDAVENDQLRYTLDDHLGSSTLELDAHASLISHEGYYPYGGTAWWSARSAVEAAYKTIRYSGKERDASGLYYYGMRYYAPWLQRWINPDPAGILDGLNLFRMVRNNPLKFVDVKGLMPTRAWDSAASASGTSIPISQPAITDRIIEFFTPLLGEIAITDVPYVNDNQQVQYKHDSNHQRVRTRRIQTAKELGLSLSDAVNDRTFQLSLAEKVGTERDEQNKLFGQCAEMAYFSSSKLEAVAQSTEHNVYTFQQPDANHTLTLLSKQSYKPGEKINWKIEHAQNSLVVDLWQGVLSPDHPTALINHSQNHLYTHNQPRSFVQTQIWNFNPHTESKPEAKKSVFKKIRSLLK